MRAWASSIIVLTLLLQGFWIVPRSVRLPIARLIGGRPLAQEMRKPLTYPFVDYPMYSRARVAGEPIERLQLIGIQRDGSETPLSPEELGLTPWHYLFLLRAVLRADTERVRGCLDAIESDATRGLASLRVEDEPLLWGEGPVRTGPRRVVTELPLREAAS